MLSYKCKITKHLLPTMPKKLSHRLSHYVSIEILQPCDWGKQGHFNQRKKNSTFSRFFKMTALATNINEIKAFLNNSWHPDASQQVSAEMK